MSEFGARGPVEVAKGLFALRDRIADDNVVFLIIEYAFNPPEPPKPDPSEVGERPIRGFQVHVKHLWMSPTPSGLCPRFALEVDSSWTVRKLEFVIRRRVEWDRMLILYHIYKLLDPDDFLDCDRMRESTIFYA
jgi:hypothetical protein